MNESYIWPNVILWNVIYFTYFDLNRCVCWKLPKWNCCMWFSCVWVDILVPAILVDCLFILLQFGFYISPDTLCDGKFTKYLSFSNWTQNWAGTGESQYYNKTITPSRLGALMESFYLFAVLPVWGFFKIVHPNFSI